ncbi:peroxidase P7 [Prunus yedoensis var. nudiflora]|uniref:peroxidase n=1 Tax=Prunus yedoensis var. nudiflora TaxID=2094558 RepID=A0A314Z1C1_PRUYE|nr:peroxidase P7 [Prunus yedoensis var. nudiflora]
MAAANCHQSVYVFVTTFFVAAAIVLVPTTCTAQLTSDFYKQSCPQALQIIRSVVQRAINREARMGASLLRLHFHDCFVNLGGPSYSYEVLLGRRDATTAVLNDANRNLPAPFFAFSQLLSSFQSHDPAFAASLQKGCPANGGDNNTAPIDSTTAHFDTVYFKSLLQKKGLFHSDQELFKSDGSDSDNLVQHYANSPQDFEVDFGASMVKMGNIKPLTGSDGEIRLNCRKIN